MITTNKNGEKRGKHHKSRNEAMSNDVEMIDWSHGDYSVSQIEQHTTNCQYSLINYLLSQACPALVRLLELLAGFASAEGNFLLLLQPFVV